LYIKNCVESLTLIILNEYDNSNRNASEKVSIASKSISGFLLALFRDKESFLLILLSILLISVIAMTSTSLFNDHQSLLLTSIAVLLAVITVYQIIVRYLQVAETGVNYNFFLLAHTFTSPDVPVNDPDDEIPKRFINGCEGDLKEARRRWEITRDWRLKEGLDDIHNEAQPYFEDIKEHYPFYWCGRGKQGHLVFYERPGELNRDVLVKGLKLTVHEMIRHYLFVTEYQWKYLAPDEMAKSISVVDMEQVSWSSLSGEPYKFLNESIKIANAHYPERSYVIYVVNAPGWFSMLWKMIKVLICDKLIIL
jgi:hypothetical protein